MPEENVKDTDMAVAEATAGLVAKNTELLSELKAAKNQLKDLESVKEAAQKWKERETKDLESKGEYEKLIQQQKLSYEQEINKLTSQLKEERDRNRGMLVQNELTSALATVDVDPVMQSAAVDLISSKVSVLEENGALKTQIGDKSISDWVKSWSKTDVGKRFVLSKAGTGAGAHSSISNGHTTMENTDWNSVFDPNSPEFNMMTQAKLLEENPDLYQRMIKKFDKAMKARIAGGGSYGHFG